MRYQTTNTRCLAKACRTLLIPFEVLDKNGNLVSVSMQGKKIFFANYSTPFNSNSFSRIAKDKEFTQFLLKDRIPMPRTLGVFDPAYDEGGEIKGGGSLDSSIKEIHTLFEFPVVVKPNSLSGGRHFKICHSDQELKGALQVIFEKGRHYDYVALVQEYLAPIKEYRVVVFQNQVKLVYTRQAQITDPSVCQSLQEFINPIFATIDISFAGLDILESEKGRFLLEMNSEPGFAYFVEKNGESPIIELYKEILTKFHA